MPLIVLSHFQVKQLLAARNSGEDSVVISLDLGLSQTAAGITAEGVRFSDGQRIDWEQVAEIAKNELACYTVRENTIAKISFYSDVFNRYYSLMPTISAPTMLISGIPMHRIKGTDPHCDTLSKIKSIAPLRGQVLDTTMGLGYTAIAAAKTADQVTTIEIDPTVLEVCRNNPWSQNLFENPTINILIGDVYEVIEDMEAGRFAGIIHDPPMFSLAGDLYSAVFYEQLLRVLRPNGKLFHYIGDPESRSGRNTTKGVKQRLMDAGFKRIRSYPQAFGVVAYK